MVFPRLRAHSKRFSRFGLLRRGAFQHFPDDFTRTPRVLWPDQKANRPGWLGEQPGPNAILAEAVAQGRQESLIVALPDFKRWFLWLQIVRDFTGRSGGRLGIVPGVVRWVRRGESRRIRYRLHEGERSSEL